MQTSIVYRDDFQKLVKCYEQHVGDRRSREWAAIFSCNPDKEAWPCHDRGYSDRDDRDNVQSRYRWLRELVEIVLAKRPEGGRFFLNKQGVFVKPESEAIMIASFDWRV